LLVGVMSDTHDAVARARRAARLLVEHGVELIIHLGDIVAPFTLKAILEEVGDRARLHALYGNNCGEKEGLRRVAEGMGAAISEPPLEMEAGGRRLLLLHGWGPADLTERIAESLALGGGWDAVLYGHTHRARLLYRRGVLILNPGEASGVLTGRATVALLDTRTLKAAILEVPA
jgi:putative phosphoesterase